MKVKSPSETAGPLGKDHKWVGHFRNHLNEGHNDGPRIRGMRDDMIPQRDDKTRYFLAQPPLTMTDSGQAVLAPVPGAPVKDLPFARGDERGMEALGKALERGRRSRGGSI